MQIEKRKQRGYSDEFVVQACVLAEANGWPIIRGSIKRTAIEVDVPESTLKGWLKENRRDDVVRGETRLRLRAELTNIMGAASMTLMRDALIGRSGMTPYEQAKASGIAADKFQNLGGGIQSTVKIEVLHRIDDTPSPWALESGDVVDAVVVEADPVAEFIENLDKTD